MPSVSTKLTEHSLNVNKGAKPVKQSLCLFFPERQRVIDKEIARLTVTNFIKEVIYSLDS